MEFVVELRNIKKVYSNGVVANRNVDFTLKKGEIHALLGENGAGKSTLMKILYGITSKTSGSMKINGREMSFSSPSEAIENEIGMVHQHFKLVQSMSIAENLVLGKEIAKKGILRKDEINNFTDQFAKKYGFEMNTKTLVRDSSVGTCQKVEILKALYRGAKVLILDEPTAVLTPQETKELFAQLKSLADKGHSIIFISHKLEEVKEICDRLTIMNDGTYVGTYNVEELTKEEISEKMIGREVQTVFEKSKPKTTEEILKLSDIVVMNSLGKVAVDKVSISVKKGSIVGIAAVEGNGTDELIESIVGLREVKSGNIDMNKKEISRISVSERRNQGMRYIPADRMKNGLVLDLSISDNLVASKVQEGYFNKGVLLNKNAMESFSNKKIRDYEVKCKNIDSTVRSLSGGNMQKVVVAREFDDSTKLIVVDQPTRGIDVGTAETIRRTMLNLKEENVGILLYSADLEELLQVCDELLVMYKGKITKKYDNCDNIELQDLGYYMLGVKKDENFN